MTIFYFHGYNVTIGKITWQYFVSMAKMLPDSLLTRKERETGWLKFYVFEKILKHCKWICVKGCKNIKMPATICLGRMRLQGKPIGILYCHYKKMLLPEAFLGWFGKWYTDLLLKCFQ